MNDLKVLFDLSHDNKNLFDDYTIWIGDKVKGGFLEMVRSKDLEKKLMNYNSTTSFLIQYLDSLPDKRRVFPIIIYVLDYVREKKLDLWMMGLDEKDIKNNLKEIIDANHFEGMYFFVIGAYHEDFFKADLAPIPAKKFDKITYY